MTIFQVTRYSKILFIKLVPPLENFVMNRVGGDYFENLLYKIFVSTDERTSVEKLAQMLDLDIEMVKVSHFFLKIFLIIFFFLASSIHVL